MLAAWPAVRTGTLLQEGPVEPSPAGGDEGIATQNSNGEPCAWVEEGQDRERDRVSDGVGVSTLGVRGRWWRTWDFCMWVNDSIDETARFDNE